jgi:hypothetical protein
LKGYNDSIKGFMTEKEGYTKVITEMNNTVGRCNRVGMGAADWVRRTGCGGLGAQ